MKKKLKILFFVAIGLSIIIGFPIHKEHTAFFWHKIPAIDAIMGVIGTLVLIAAKKMVALFAQREEDYHD